MGKDKTKDGETAASEARDGCQESWRDHSQDQEARDAALAQTIAEAVTRETQTIAEVVAREMAKAHAQYQATVNENHAPTLPTTLKVTSGSNGFRIMDPFNWTRDKTTRHGNYGHIRLDSPLMPWKETQEKTKISYFHHWINGEDISHMDGKTTKSSSASQTMMH